MDLVTLALAKKIPFIDLVEMGLPAIVLDISGTGTYVKLTGWDSDKQAPTGVDFTEFENALQRGIVRIRFALNAGFGEFLMTAICSPLYNETQNMWMISSLGYAGGNVLFVTLSYSSTFTEISDDAGNVEVYAGMDARCVLLQQFTM